MSPARRPRDNPAPEAGPAQKGAGVKPDLFPAFAIYPSAGSLPKDLTQNNPRPVLITFPITPVKPEESEEVV